MQEIDKTVLFGQDVILQLQLLAKQEVNVVKIQPIDVMVDPQAMPASLPAWCHAFSLCTAIETELQCLKEADVIESVQEATHWVSPLVPVWKSNGTLRLCIDYRRLNQAITWERHMLPTLEEITAKLDGAGMFVVLDAESGFYQIPLSRIQKIDYIYYALCPPVLLQETSIWNSLRSQNLSACGGGHPERTGGCPCLCR